MNTNPLLCLIISVILITYSCTGKGKHPENNNVYIDKPYQQDYSIKYYKTDSDAILMKAFTDRNGYVQVLSSEGLMKPGAGQFLYPGKLEKDTHYRPLSDKKITGLDLYKKQFVYLDDKAILSNAWAGELYSLHGLTSAKLFAAGNDFYFLISDGKKLILNRNSETIWEGCTEDEYIKDIKYNKFTNIFWVLGKSTVSCFSPVNNKIEKVISDSSVTCMYVADNDIIIGTTDGYLLLDQETKQLKGAINRKMPWPVLTTVAAVHDKIWFGSEHGAMMLNDNGSFSYYASERWIPSDTVIHISEGPGNSVLILTTGGLARICFRNLTLNEKAGFFERQVRERHIRHGFNATLGSMKNGDVATGSLEDSDNDGLWTSMYLASQAFRYSVTQSEEALENISESLMAIERLYTINKIPGFPSRSFERRGYKFADKPWRRADDPEWDWKSTTSSDEAIGHIFAFGVIAETVKVPEIRDKAILLIDTLMSNIVKNDLYLIDWDSKPTTWGKWNPEYVNHFPEMVGDRKLNSSNIIAMLQTAYYFTGKKKYRDEALHLMNDHGYLVNLMRPFREIGIAPENSDELSRNLSETWNHSDDEMYFCGYWGLYNYAFNDSLKNHYREAIIDHWKTERPEKEALWNIMTAMTGLKDIDLEEAVWYLREYPMDLIEWPVMNSHRKDIEFVEPGFRGQTTREVLPPDELRISRHNSNRFVLDGDGKGQSEMSAGDIWLLPYWAGRYYGVISQPVD